MIWWIVGGGLFIILYCWLFCAGMAEVDKEYAKRSAQVDEQFALQVEQTRLQIEEQRLRIERLKRGSS